MLRRPEWMDFEYIDQCYEVEENIYDPDLLRSVIESRLDELGIKFEQSVFFAGDAWRLRFRHLGNVRDGSQAAIFLGSRNIKWPRKF